MRLMVDHVGNVVEKGGNYHSSVSMTDRVASAGVLEDCLFRAMRA